MKRKQNHRRTALAVFSVTLALTGCIAKPLPVESHFNRGVELYDQGKHADAIEEYKLALRRDPDDTFAKYNLAVVYQDQGKLDQAAALYRDILKETEDTNSRINLAVLHYSRNDKEAAYRELKAAAKGNPDNPNPLSILGNYLEQENGIEEAKQYYRDALSIDDQHAVTHFRLGRLYCNQSNADRCEKHLQQAVDLAADEPAYLELLAEHYRNAGNPLEAIHWLERVSVLQPDREDIFVRLGDLYKKEKHYKEAAERYWSANAINGNNPHVHRNLSEIFQILAQSEKERLQKLEQESSVAKTP